MTACEIGQECISQWELYKYAVDQSKSGVWFLRVTADRGYGDDVNRRDFRDVSFGVRGQHISERLVVRSMRVGTGI